MFLGGANTYSGLTAVTAGVLVLQNAGALGTTAAGTTVADGTRLEPDNLTVTGEAITIAGAGGDNLGALRSRSLNSVWTGNVTVAADLTRIGAITGSTFEVSGVIDDGPNDYRVRFRPNNSTVIISGPNTYTGGTSVFGGTVVASSLNSVVGGTASSNFGAPVTAANGMIIFGISTTSGTLNYVGAGETTDRTVQIGDNTSPTPGNDTGTGAIENNGITGPLVFSAPVFNTPTNNTVNANAPTRVLTLGGTNTGANTISGTIQNNQVAGAPTAPVSLTKAGAGSWTLTGINTYTGPTLVSGGVLALVGGSQTSPITVNDGASLGFTVGSTTSSTSTVTFNTGSTVTITGTPTLNSYTLMTAASFAGIAPVLASPIAGYELKAEGTTLKLAKPGYNSWASLNGAGPNLEDDHDNDGVANGVEFFLGGPNGNTTGFTALPGVVDTAGVLSITWPKGTDYIGAYPTDFLVETSTTLSGVWTTEPIGGGNITDTVTEVKYTFPGPLSGKNFARLKVTGP